MTTDHIRTLIDDHYKRQLGCYFTEVVHTCGLTHTFGSWTTDPIWNHTYVRGGDLRAASSSAREFHHSRDRDVALYLDWNEDLVSVAESAGLVAFDDEMWMTADARATDPHRLAYSLVTDERERSRLAATIGAVFRPDYTGAIANEVPHSGRRHYLAVRSDGLYAVGSLYIGESGIAALHNIAVVPEHRSSGWGSDVVRFLLTEAEAFDVSVCYLQCEAAHREFYESLGFVGVHRRLGFVASSTSGLR